MGYFNHFFATFYPSAGYPFNRLRYWFQKKVAPIKVNDMISVMQNCHEVLYFGTNKGIYSYTFAK
jgi:hypothetical protein